MRSFSGGNSDLGDRRCLSTVKILIPMEIYEACTKRSSSLGKLYTVRVKSPFNGGIRKRHHFLRLIRSPGGKFNKI